MIQKFTYFVCFLLISTSVTAQKVGLVLSGGGAPGFAHIGVIKALEENGIPIDYITGTSAGALVGAMYASGMTPDEMIAYISNDDFIKMSRGKLTPDKKFLLQRQTDDASLIEIPFSFDSLLVKSLPINLVKPYSLDFEMLKHLGVAGANNNKNFDQLFVPFRCVASDVTSKSSVVFSKGNLNEAVRASLTYPFYFNPIRVDGKLLFDGGLYNNFPADVMYRDFNSDFIIGSTVTDNAAPPLEDNLISQITNLLMRHSDFSIPCENGYIIKPHPSIGTFDFAQVMLAIEEGYDETIKNIDKIKAEIARRVDAKELQQKRQAFKQKIVPVIISEVSSNRPNRYKFITKSLLHPKERKPLTIEKLEKRFFRLTEMDHLSTLYPTIELKPDSTYRLNVYIRESKHFKLEGGGHFSSRPINVGYLALNYYHLNRYAWHLKAESYFGKFYTSARLAANFQAPMKYPIIFTPYFILNRWDYYRSSTSFFENVQPSFLIQSEVFGGFKVKSPIGNKAILELDIRGLENKDSYYLKETFTKIDTADFTLFKGFVGGLLIEENTLNKKQFANGGTLLRFSVKYVQGKEFSRPGTVLKNQDQQIEKEHRWINIRARYNSYIVNTKVFHLGIDAIGVINSQSLFSNYKATILSMTAFAPIPDMETFFMEEYRSPQYLGAGLNFVFTPFKNFDVRIDGYYYQPFKSIVKNEDDTFNYSKLFKGERYILSGSTIYHTPIGPVRLTLNYFHRSEQPLIFQFSFGYILFNERSFR